MLPDHRRQLVESDLAGLFRKPFISVVVFGRTYCKMKMIWMAAPSLFRIQDYCLYTFMAVRCYTATIQCSHAVDDGYLITGAVSEHFYAVAGFVLIQTADAAFYVAGKEKFHGNTQYSRKNTLILRICI